MSPADAPLPSRDTCRKPPSGHPPGRQHLPDPEAEGDDQRGWRWCRCRRWESRFGAQGLHLIVSDIEAAREELVAHGVEPSDVFHCSTGYACRFPGNDAPVSGPDPHRRTYGSFLTSTDPDGNDWLLQEVTTRFPGRVAGDTTYASAGDLSQALQRAAAAHGEYEARTGRAESGEREPGAIPCPRTPARSTIGGGTGRRMLR
jgi:hypothetical protein